MTMNFNAEFSAEFFPPRDPKDDDALLIEVKKIAEYRPRYLSVTYGPAGLWADRTAGLARRIREETGIETAAHMTCIGQKKDILFKQLDMYATQGIKHIVALRGDIPRDKEKPAPDDTGYFHYANEFVEGIKAHNPDFDISVGAYPETHRDAVSAAEDLRYLKQKIDAGARRAVTQFFFETDIFVKFVEQAQAAGIDCEIVAGLSAINDFERICRYAKGAKAHMPDTLIKQFADPHQDHLSLAAVFLENQIETLIQGGARHFHFYTLNTAEPLIRVLEKLEG